jgi:inhibitor of cysteine peptidase
MSKSVRRFPIGKSVVALLLGIMVVGAVAGCAGQTRASDEGANLEAVVLDAAKNGSTVELKKGQSLVVELEGNPSTGYNWQAADLDEAILKQVGEPEFEAESDLVGAPGTVTLRFEAAGAGQVELKLVYQRPWEEAVEPLETFTVQVTVS